MRSGLTNTERIFFNDKGFLIVENVLSASEVAEIVAIVDKLYEKFGGESNTGRLEVRNCIAKHPLFLKLIENENILPMIIDLLGPNIKIRSSNLDVRPPLKRESIKKKLGQESLGGSGEWHVDGPIFGYPSVNGILPMMELKVGFYLTDLLEPDSGCLCVIPESHKLDSQMLFDENFQISEKYVFKVQVPAGSAIIFRTGLWHCTSPNFSELTRKVLYYAYTYRWIEPSDYILQSEELLYKCSPIQRQLLGATAYPERYPLGNEPERDPCSFYWYSSYEDIPLHAWFKKLQQVIPSQQS